MKVRGETTRRAVLRAAEAVFAERGYAGARMDEVAERVGIRRASMVYYFRDKKSLYEALLDDLFNDLPARYRAALDAGGPLKDRVLGCIDVWSAQVIDRPGLLRISLWELARAGRSRAVPLASRIAPIVKLLADAVRMGQREGVFRSVDPVRYVMSVAGATAFLTLGMTLTGAPELDSEALGTELRGLTRLILFVD
ncbi:MAG TPA: TetR/AcrR family transcriptional regulator [Candidatus Eisenbacteria bacterium]|nr:TetR/AcrR family transcriptional regulator [Candidatus Eisenbacteria bacterium]